VFNMAKEVGDFLGENNMADNGNWNDGASSWANTTNQRHCFYEDTNFGRTPRAGAANSWYSVCSSSEVWNDRTSSIYICNDILHGSGDRFGGVEFAGTFYWRPNEVGHGGIGINGVLRDTARDGHAVSLWVKVEGYSNQELWKNEHCNTGQQRSFIAYDPQSSQVDDAVVELHVGTSAKASRSLHR
jgi:peptidase inhibitor family I36